MPPPPMTTLDNCQQEQVHLEVLSRKENSNIKNKDQGKENDDNMQHEDNIKNIKIVLVKKYKKDQLDEENDDVNYQTMMFAEELIDDWIHTLEVQEQSQKYERFLEGESWPSTPSPNFDGPDQKEETFEDWLLNIQSQSHEISPDKNSQGSGQSGPAESPG